jgi:Domain of unknown function (DUF4386)
MDNAARTRRRVLALFLPVAAVLYIGGEAVSPKGTDQVVTTTAVALKVLPIAAQHQTQLYLASALVLLGLGALAASYGAIATLVRGRGSALATVAALLGGLGAFCGAIVNVVAYPTLAAASAAPVSRGAAANLLVAVSNSEFGQVFGYVYFASEFLAPVLMGIALWRSRGVPRWLAALFFVGLQVGADGVVRTDRDPVHAAVRGGDGPAGRPHLVCRRPVAGPEPHPGAGQCGGLRFCSAGSSLCPLCCEDKT